MPFVGLDFDVDRYINPFVPRSGLYLLPKSISWFLGHRAERRPPLGSVLVWWWAFIGAFCSILIIEAVFQTEAFKMEGTPIVIASLVCRSHLDVEMLSNVVFRVQPQYSNSTPSTRLSLNPAAAFWARCFLPWLA